jgi:hypothetical protein
MRQPKDRCYLAPTFEVVADVHLAKNQLVYRTATLEAEGTMPEMLIQILA